MSGKSYRFEANLLITSDAIADFKFTFTGADGSYKSLYASAQTASNGWATHRTGESETIAYNASLQSIRVEGMFYATGAGPFKLQWAQGTSDAANTTVEQNSLLVIEELLT